MKPFRLGTETDVLRRFYTNEWNEGANVIEFDLIALKTKMCFKQWMYELKDNVYLKG